MTELITRTRVQPPRLRADVLSRPRVLDIFSDLLNSKLILVVAPAGYGKTLALVDLVHHLDVPVCWYSLGPTDYEPHRFIEHFVAALERQYPGLGAETKAALQGYTAGSGTLEQVVITLANELHIIDHSDFVYVVDDFHLAGDTADINRFLSQFIQQVDERCHLIVASRTLLDLPDMALMVARGQVAGFDFESLAFRPDELQVLAQRNYGVELTAQMAEEMVAATEGWITGLLLSGHAQKWQKASQLHPVRASGVSLYGYLQEQVLDRQTDYLREFLLRTSLMEEIDAGLCSAAFDPKWLPPGNSWQGMIEEVLQSNLFAMPIGEADAAIRYHHLFQEFLQQTLSAERPGEELTILRNLTSVYVSREQWEQAYVTARRLDDPQLTAWVIEQSGLRLVHAGRILLLQKWLNDLSPVLLSERPELVSLKGYNLVLLGKVEAGRRLLDQACARLESDPAAQTEYAQALIFRSKADRYLGDYHRTEEDADEVLALASRPDSLEEGRQDLVASAQQEKGLALCMMGSLELGIEWLQLSLASFQEQRDVQSVATVLKDIAIEYANSGQNEEALRMFESAYDAWQSVHNLVGQASVLNSLGVHYHQLAEYDRALDALARALDCARRSGYARMEAFASASLGDIFVELEMSQAAHEVYAQAYQIAQRVDERFLLLYLELVRSELAWSSGHWDVAYGCLDAAGRMVLDHNSTYEWGLYRLAMGRFYLARGEPRAALEPLDDAATCFTSGGQFPEAAKAELYRAIALSDLGDSAYAEESLNEALQATGELELQHPIVVAASKVVDKLDAFRKYSNPSFALQRLLKDVDDHLLSLPQTRRRIRQQAAGILPSMYLEGPTLVVRALGRTEVAVRGRIVTGRDWKTRSARDLFLCFLAHPEGLTKEETGVLFWPDASPDQLRTRFKNAIYRLRNALGGDVIQFSDNVYHFDWSFDYDYDVESFERWLAEAKRYPDPENRAVNLERALAVYGGPYLADVEAGWASVERERLHRLYIDAGIELAKIYFERDESDRALDWCQRLLEEDPCLEDVHRLIMQIHAASGNRAGVVRQYELCQRSLEEEIAAPPSALTEELFASLMD